VLCECVYIAIMLSLLHFISINFSNLQTKRNEPMNCVEKILFILTIDLKLHSGLQIHTNRRQFQFKLIFANHCVTIIVTKKLTIG